MKNLTDVLKEELIPAMGCTEPIALAYGAAVAKENFSGEVESCKAIICGNIIKNVKSVVVPNTNGLKGVETAVAAGITIGSSKKGLEILFDATDETRRDIKSLLDKGIIKLIPANNSKIFYIEIVLKNADHETVLVIEDSHTNITKITVDGKLVFTKECQVNKQIDNAFMTVDSIYDYVNSVNIEDIRDCVSRQINYNYNIAQEGIKGNYGANIGKVLLGMGQDIAIKAKAMAAAGSDARMSGCEMPVVIVSGSGNQGMTASIPVIVYGKELAVDEERLIRAVALSDLITVHQKTGIGKLSAFCGAVSAACGAACGIAYLNGGDLDIIKHTIVNTLGIASGMVCDGAKSSCAAKIATAVEAGILGWKMYLAGQQFYSGEGIIGSCVDSTISNVGRMAHDGMRETDREIIEIMTQC